jgi:primosomal protein N''
MTGFADVLVHHLRRIATSAGTTFDGDSEAETRAEVEALEQRLAKCEARLDALEEHIDRPDWRDRR